MTVPTAVKLEDADQSPAIENSHGSRVEGELSLRLQLCPRAYVRFAGDSPSGEETQPAQGS